MRTPNHFPLAKAVCTVYLYVVFHFVASFLAHTERIYREIDRRLMFFLFFARLRKTKNQCGQQQANTFTTFNLENSSMVAAQHLLLRALCCVCVCHPFPLNRNHL